MANSELYGKVIGKVPNNIIEYIRTYIQNNQGLEKLEGYQRASELLSDQNITYSQAKKIKHFFDNYSSINGNRHVYELNGGIKMKNFIEHLLGRVRDGVIRGKEIRGLAFDNQFRKTHNKTFDRPQQLRNLTSLSQNNKNHISENNTMTRPKQASIAFVFNNEGKLLLLQRERNDDWMPTRWATIGGGLEDGEDHKDSLIREAIEEANAELDNVLHAFDKVEDNTHVYVYKATCKNPDDIKISPEHEKFKWVDVHDVHKFNTVPDLLEDLNKILNNEYTK